MLGAGAVLPVNFPPIRPHLRPDLVTSDVMPAHGATAHVDNDRLIAPICSGLIESCGVFVALAQVVMLVLVGVVMPESPRWLVRKGRVEEAKAVLVTLYQPGTDVDQVQRPLALALFGTSGSHCLALSGTGRQRETEGRGRSREVKQRGASRTALKVCGRLRGRWS